MINSQVFLNVAALKRFILKHHNRDLRESISSSTSFLGLISYLEMFYIEGVIPEIFVCNMNCSRTDHRTGFRRGQLLHDCFKAEQDNLKSEKHLNLIFNLNEQDFQYHFLKNTLKTFKRYFTEVCIIELLDQEYKVYCLKALCWPCAN